MGWTQQTLPPIETLTTTKEIFRSKPTCLNEFFDVMVTILAAFTHRVDDILLAHSFKVLIVNGRSLQVGGLIDQLTMKVCLSFLNDILAATILRMYNMMVITLFTPTLRTRSNLMGGVML